MLEGRLLHRAFWTAVTGATIGLTGAPAPARDSRPPRACLTAYRGAQERQRAGQLREGRELLLECAKASCGGLQKKCAAAAEQLAASIGLITPVITDDKGSTLLDVRVLLDGEPVATRLDGRPLAVDPGPHQLSVSARVGPWPGRESAATRAITVGPGERTVVAITLPPVDGGDATSADLATAADHAAPEPEAPPVEAPDRAAPEPAPPVTVRRSGPSAFAYLLGGVGLAGVGAGGLLTYWGKTDNAALGACAPNCQPASVDHIRRLYLAADLSFAGGGAALGVAALLFAFPHVEVLPTKSGAVASFRGAF